jgi:hypothetical protein
MPSPRSTRKPTTARMPDTAPPAPDGPTPAGKPADSAGPADSAAEHADQEPPARLNRAARRAQRRGKSPTQRATTNGPFSRDSHRDQVAGVHRRQGRRGNR